ncbi:DegQ family serine endoprotease [Varunaivibrio sulfuroxidans]|uniref:Probable periplasmic serine endoprotease DegP-like n=1 Tax=Varunaivibrio sulfuroxidans TaxID=1773489 RepID=A0A4R3J523_9PROT|nr:DegQ family serine endoprotease [Varunaivibrio sulfuroxidans]TCS60979.1 serine protease Do [Varunaivibrio sulfuroxidans]WES31614.1 DegQ family serine endoprotease [Varunaivibrio sulfuroxidans]
MMNTHESYTTARAAMHAPGRRLSLSVLVTAFVLALMFAASAHAKGAPESFAPLVHKLLPAVVNISSTQTIETRDGPAMPQFPPGSPFEQFFKDFMDRGGQPNQMHKRKATSLGSGFIIQDKADGDAYVVTNNHVIQHADSIHVILQDNTRLKATLVGRDTKSDIAVLKIHTKRKLASVPFGNSDAAQVGDWVVAIGNPFGLGGTVTAGIISARGRDIRSGPYDNFIQTDASINRGNSGGPMFNMEGQVIGINTAIYSPSGGSVGIGFAIPSMSAEPVIKQLIAHGEVRRGWLGVRIQDVTPEIADTLGLKDAKGALVSSVIKNGPAEKAGLKPGDVIVTFDGKDVPAMRKLPRIVAITDIGKRVDVRVWRDGAYKDLWVTLGKLDDKTEAAAEKGSKTPPPAAVSEKKVAGLGLTLSKLTPELIKHYDLADNTQGVVVTGVDENGPAVEKGIREGDVIVEVSQRKVSTPAEVSDLIAKARKDGRKSVILWLEGQSGMRFAAVRIGK